MNKTSLRWKASISLIISLFFLGFYFFTITIAGVNDLAVQKIWSVVGLTVMITYTSFFTIFQVALVLVEKLNALGIYRGDWKRWGIPLIIIILITTLFTLFTYNTYLIPSPVFHSNSEKESFVLMFLPNFLFVTLIFTVAEIRNALQENETLQLKLVTIEKEKVASQLTALQQKINPHFLFNSLSVLSELIHKDANKADEFIREFSRIYRYVLEFHEEVTVSLREELAFLEAYAFLEKIRFGKNLIVNIEIDDQSLSQHIPPLSLQLLFENAVKHNRITEEEPLNITIENEQDKLIVKNNLQSRMDVPLSYGVGLSNLRRTYELISNRDFRYYEKENRFIVELPLVNHNKYD